jgi:hypothetical protein
MRRHHQAIHHGRTLRAAMVLRTLGNNKVDPPIPPKPGETIV